MKNLIQAIIFSFGFSYLSFADPMTNISPKELTWDTYNAVSQHASQTSDELLYLKVDWKDTVLDAQREAHKADKPIVMILFFGDHRSNC